MWRSPGLTVAAVLAIALGIGVNVGIFSVLNGLALRLLPIPRAEQIVSVNQIFHGRSTRNTHDETSMFSYSEYLDYRDHNHVFTGLVAYEPFVEATLAGGTVQQVLGTATSCNYFDVLSEHPAQGRGFVDSDCAAPGENAVVVVSDDLWRGRFAADPSLVGKRITLNRTAYTVVGIARPGFTGTEPIPSAFWAPITMQEALEPGSDRLADDNMSWLALLGRMRPGVTMQQVRADLGVIAGRIDQRHPGRTTSLAIRTATFFASPEEREFLIPVASVILAAFALVLLIACANVANLLLARASVRHKEIALRLSIGASRWRLVRQLLTESLLLSLAGGLLGSLLAFWSFRKITQLCNCLTCRMTCLPSRVNVAPDLSRARLRALAHPVSPGFAFGLVPALQSSRLDLNTAMKGDGTVIRLRQEERTVFAECPGRRASRRVHGPVAGSRTCCCVGFIMRRPSTPDLRRKTSPRCFSNLRAQGYDEAPRDRLYRGACESASEASLAYRSCASGVRAAKPRLQCRPLHASWPARQSSPSNTTTFRRIIFPWLAFPLCEAAALRSMKRRDAPGVIVTESTARRLWPGEDPLGKTLRGIYGRRICR